MPAFRNVVGVKLPVTFLRPLQVMVLPLPFKHFNDVSALLLYDFHQVIACKADIGLMIGVRVTSSYFVTAA